MVVAVRLAYLDTSVVADWLLLRAASDEARERFSDAVRSSYELVEGFLNDSLSLRACTSKWSLCEAAMVLKQSTVALKLILDNVSLRYLERLMDDERYRPSVDDVTYIRMAMRELLRRAKKARSFRVIEKVYLDSDRVIDLSLRYCLAAPDAFHLTIALRNECDVFVTRDRDFLDRADKLRSIIKIVHPRMLTAGRY